MIPQRSFFCFDIKQITNEHSCFTVIKAACSEHYPQADMFDYG